MKLVSLKIPDLLMIHTNVYEDERGFFSETYHYQRFSENGVSPRFVQDNHSGSKKGTLRGLHYQIQHPQGKLISVVVGEIYDVAVDIRRSSPTFGQWAGVHLSARNKNQLWVPAGFAHGFYALSEWAEVIYKVTDYYDLAGERCIKWNDPYLNVDWRIDPQTPLFVSSKDEKGTAFQDAELFDQKFIRIASMHALKTAVILSDEHDQWECQCHENYSFISVLEKQAALRCRFFWLKTGLCCMNRVFCTRKLI